MINRVNLHVFLSTAALIIMAAAGLQAVLLMLQDNYLRRHKKNILPFLPPIERLEKYLFRTLILGWLLLSFIFISSLWFFKHAFTRPLESKTLLTLITLSVFSALLLGRFQWGLRGRAAIRWTFFGFLLLLTLYCGTGLLLHDGYR